MTTSGVVFEWHLSGVAGPLSSHYLGRLAAPTPIQGLWACTRTPFSFFDWFQNNASLMGLVVDEDYVLTDGAADPIGYLDVS